MLYKVSGLARTLYIVLAIVAGIIVLPGLNVGLALVVLGLIAGISTPRDRLVLAFAAVLALPLVGTALAQIPMVGDKLNAIAANLALGIAGAAATATAALVYEMAMDGVTGLTGTESGGGRKATA